MKYTWYILAFVSFVVFLHRVEPALGDLLIILSTMVFGFLYMKSCLDEEINKLKTKIEKL